MRQLIAICGLDCEECDAYKATKNNDQALREKTAKLWSELNNAPILPEHINCEGCRMNGTKNCLLQFSLRDTQMCYSQRIRNLCRMHSKRVLYEGWDCLEAQSPGKKKYGILI